MPHGVLVSTWQFNLSHLPTKCSHATEYKKVVKWVRAPNSQEAHWTCTTSCDLESQNKPQA